jgi:hypothetical protein
LPIGQVCGLRFDVGIGLAVDLIEEVGSGLRASGELPVGRDPISGDGGTGGGYVLLQGDSESGNGSDFRSGNDCGFRHRNFFFAIWRASNAKSAISSSGENE